jgi:hypothetical protein
VVICERPTPEIAAHAPAWILLYPGDANLAIVTHGGSSRQIDQPSFAALLAELDALLTRLAPGEASEGPAASPAPA